MCSSTFTFERPFAFAHPVQRVPDMDLTFDIAYVSREICLCVNESRLRFGSIHASLARTQGQRCHCLAVCRAQIRIPLEAFKHLFIFFKLHYRITIILCFLIVVDCLDFSIFECRREHLGLGFINCGKHLLFFKEKYGRSSAQHIETFKIGLVIKISYHFGAFYLVEMAGVFLYGNE